MLRQRTAIHGDVRGEALTVECEAMVCNRCGFQVLNDEQSNVYNITIADAYREKHGLLTSAELKLIRKRLMLSQQEFADFLKVGVASVKRWELGLIQDPSMDHLIRIKTDLSTARSNLHDLEVRLGADPETLQLHCEVPSLSGRRIGTWNVGCKKPTKYQTPSLRLGLVAQMQYGG
jgi:putative zinc finger/helix-turn-helix YgiT family protein